MNPLIEQVDRLSSAILLDCGWCGGKQHHGQGENGPCSQCNDRGAVWVERRSLLSLLRMLDTDVSKNDTTIPKNNEYSKALDAI